MNIDFRQQLTDLSALIERLKKRCLTAEERASELERQIATQQAQINELESKLADMDMKYRNLQLGMTALGNDPEQIAKLKEKYLAMVSEIDACIATLQHG